MGVEKLSAEAFFSPVLGMDETWFVGVEEFRGFASSVRCMRHRVNCRDGANVTESDTTYLNGC